MKSVLGAGEDVRAVGEVGGRMWMGIEGQRIQVAEGSAV